MIKYDIIREELQDRVDSGLLTLEEAEIVNELAYDKYVVGDITESVGGMIGAIAREFPEKAKLVKGWGILKNKCKVYERDNVSDKDYDKIVSLIKHMKEDKTYIVYKKHFNDLCKILGINPSVIIEYKWKKGEKDKNYVYFRYENKNKKVTIPNGYNLYHISPVSNIKELTPKFRGKAPRCYFYSTPRVYVSIKKDMAKGFAQFKGDQADVKTTKYQLCENIKTAYLDDRIGNIRSGAVYIETIYPIKVIKIDEEK